MAELPPIPQTPLHHIYICNVCGSDHVTRDACAAWDVAAQEWVREVAFDQSWCHRCMSATRLDQVVLTSPITFAAPDTGPYPDRATSRG
ncbi:hypothetical protein [Sphingobium sp. Z007]|uniref:hypothetical protein n=1 Tax=Sphingobium sp. Z007 TaxID=627495 RepID=UPI000B49756C|nr:hypothetical protein [Sphingobium sp. Z007]